MRQLTSEEIRSALGDYYDFNGLVSLIKQYKENGESVYCYFNGFRLSPYTIGQYNSYANNLRDAVSGKYYDPADYDDRLKDDSNYSRK